MADHTFAVSDLLNELHERINLEFHSVEEENALRQNYGEEWWRAFARVARQRQRQYKSREVEEWLLGQHEKIEEPIQRFLTVHFKGASKGEANFIREQIGRELKAPDGNYDFCLFDMVHGGLRSVRRRYRGRYARYIRQSAWSAIKGLIMALVTLMIFTKTQTDFETIVAALLILSYTYALRIAYGAAFVNASFNQAGYIRYLSLKELMPFPPPTEEYEGLFTLERDMRQSRVCRYVVDVGLSIVNLIAGWNLFKALLH